MKKLTPATRNLLTALVILAALYPALIALAIHGATWIGTGTAAVLLARVSPAHTHRRLHRLTGPTIASWITGHHPAPAPARTYAHAPSNGPQVPVRNPVAN